ncbi:hypothetical protein LTR66_016935, partial [Elasticomyces elasticus]
LRAQLDDIDPSPLIIRSSTQMRPSYLESLLAQLSIAFMLSSIEFGLSEEEMEGLCYGAGEVATIPTAHKNNARTSLALKEKGLESEYDADISEKETSISKSRARMRRLTT